jgi:hypothetical protein
MGSIFNIYDIILLFVTVFIGFRLINILGVSQDVLPTEKPMKIVTPVEEEIQSKSRILGILTSCKELVTPKQNNQGYQLSENGINILNYIKKQDKTFELGRFIKTAVGIYSKVIYLMNKLHLKELSDYCSKTAFEEIVEYVSYNKSKGFIIQQSLSNYQLIDIVEAKNESGVQYITLKLEVHLIRVVFNEMGDMASGDRFDPIIFSDEITFRRGNEESQWKLHDLGNSLTSNEI